ncbi:cytochrome d ubiquinol oxidase subunit II [Actinomyces minihominis]|uniref:cytochrome d ubiquinol oxidase subunit II n=1 Tax=Actinomyces minihominis TaxID=2002838 RepID=UPI000C07B5F9|nr:cytochrome d ubiquinol oxidase subunit II [Actinomyces minihominis]
MTALVVIWFILIAVLWTVYLILEGFDFGVGMILRTMTKSDEERTAVVRSIGPHWDGNEVWLLTAGGAMFAAFPLWYSTMFSGMYMAFFLLLVLLILRIVAIEWRSKIISKKWRNTWDWFQTISAFGVPIILGVAFSNLVAGMKIEAQQWSMVDGRLSMTTVDPSAVQDAMASGTLAYNMVGSFWSLFTPYTLWGGVTIAAICFAGGTQFLSLKMEGDLQKRVTAASAPASIVAVVTGAVWVTWGQLAYSSNQWSWLPLLLAAVALILTAFYSQKAYRNEKLALTYSSLGVAFAVAWVFSTMAPYVLKSSIDPAYSLTMEWASSTTPTLTVMLVVAIILVPIVIGYTLWSYWVFRGRINPEEASIPTGLHAKLIRPKANFLTGKQ